MQKVKKRVFRMMMLFSLFVFCSYALNAQQKTVSGSITEASTGTPVIGASVQVKGTKAGTVSDMDGNFTLLVPENGKTVVVSYIGFVTQELPIDKTTFDIALKESATDLDELVVIGYGTTKKRDLTGAISSVSAKDLVAAPVASVGEALAGKLAGVNVTTSEGSPDAEIRIRVRGGGSLTQDNSPLYIVDGFPVNTISDIAINDILSIDVLKDASSTAIYGARGANGVIIITTKGGEAGKITVNYNAYYGLKQLANRLDVLNPDDYALWQYELAMLKDDKPDNYNKYLGNWEDIDMYNGVVGNDWLDLVFGRQGSTFNQNLSISGGTDNTKYAFSYGHINETPIMEMSKFNRDNLSLKMTNNPNKRIQLDLSVRWSQTKIKGSGVNDGGSEKGSSTDTRLKNAMIYTPIPVQGLIGDDGDTDPDFNLYNPLTSMKDNDRDQVRRGLNLNGSASWEVMDNLKLKTEVGLDQFTNKDSRFYGSTTYYVKNNPAKTEYAGHPAVIFTNRQREVIRNTNTANYNFKDILPKGHNLNLLLGQEMIIAKSEVLTSEAQGFGMGYDLDMAMRLSVVGFATNTDNYYSPDDKMLSGFGRVNYDYEGKYLFSTTMRADGSSKFARGNRWGYFPSVSAGWRISAEDFMKSTSLWLHDLKLRASYGTAGNNNIPSGLIVQTFSPSNTTWVNDANFYWAPGKTMANPNLKWETTVTRNLGLDFSFLGGKIGGVVELYKNTTKDLLIAMPTAGTGYDQQYLNIGETQNSGVEISANWFAIQKKNYTLSFNANIGFNKSNINSLGDRGNFYEQTGWAGSGSGGVYNDFAVLVNGQVGQMWGYLSDGRYEVSDFEGYDAVTKKWILKEGVTNCADIVGDLRPGLMKLQDKDGDHKVTYDDKDKTVIGNANPVHTGGFNINAGAYGFDLGLYFNWSYGNDVYNANKIEFTQTHKFTMRNTLEDMASGKRWTNLDPTTGTIVNDPAQLEAMNANTTTWSPYVKNYVFSDYYVEDGSFLRLNTLTLGYTLPDAMLAKLHIQNLRLYCSAYNVALWTNYSGFDPEVNTRRKTALTPGVDCSAYPRSRSLVVGINLTF